MTGRIAIRVVMQEGDIVAILVVPLNGPSKTATNEKECGVVREDSVVDWCALSVRVGARRFGSREG
jgi:hypothetical protein